VIVDTSALLAILLGEEEAARFASAILDAPSAGISVANVLETAIVLERRGNAQARSRLDPLVADLGLAFLPVTVAQMHRARAAFTRFGKGRHPAGLNFGDCFAYALAEETGEPLLFKGEHFARTDIARAL